MEATPLSDAQNFHVAGQSFVDFKTETVIKKRKRTSSKIAFRNLSGANNV
jgi:hypothetical protein